MPASLAGLEQWRREMETNGAKTESYALMESCQAAPRLSPMLTTGEKRP